MLAMAMLTMATLLANHCRGYPAAPRARTIGWCEESDTWSKAWWNNCGFAWLVGPSIGWFVGCLLARSIGWLVGWCIFKLIKNWCAFLQWWTGFLFAFLKPTFFSHTTYLCDTATPPPQESMALVREPFSDSKLVLPGEQEVSYQTKLPARNKYKKSIMVLS